MEQSDRNDRRTGEEHPGGEGSLWTLEPREGEVQVGAGESGEEGGAVDR